MTMSRTVSLRHGVTYWRSGYVAMLRYQLTGLRTFLVFAVVIQVLMSAGMIFMYGFYLGDLPPSGQRFLITGIPALALFPIGFIMVPGEIGRQKLAGNYDYERSLPVPGIASTAATFTVYTLIALPGLVIALVLAAIRYDVGIDIAGSIVPAVVLVSIMAISVGFALGHGVRDPRVTNLITNVLVFAILLFSPIVVPIEHFPGWLAGLHRVLPFYHMTQVLRASLSDGLVSGLAASYVVLAAWTAGSWVVAAWSLSRQR
jgi:ABC-2 type transport system permease protein